MYYHCQRRVQNLLKHLRWSFLLKAVNSFYKKIHLRFWVLNRPLMVICTIAWTEFKTTLKQCWDKSVNQCWNNVQTTLKNGCIDVVQCWFNVVSALYQRWTMLKIRRYILFHFQHPIDVFSKLIWNVEVTWSVDEMFSG